MTKALCNGCQWADCCDCGGGCNCADYTPVDGDAEVQYLLDMILRTEDYSEMIGEYADNTDMEEIK